MIQNIIHVFLWISLLSIIYDYIYLLWEVYSKHELSTINMLYFLKKFAIAHPHHNAHPSTMATFFCPQGGHCGGVRLLSQEILILSNNLCMPSWRNLTTASVKSNWKGVSKTMKIYLNLRCCSYVLSYGLLWTTPRRSKLHKCTTEITWWSFISGEAGTVCSNR